MSQTSHPSSFQTHFNIHRLSLRWNIPLIHNLHQIYHILSLNIKFSNSHYVPLQVVPYSNYAVGRILLLHSSHMTFAEEANRFVLDFFRVALESGVHTEKILAQVLLCKSQVSARQMALPLDNSP